MSDPAQRDVYESVEGFAWSNPGWMSVGVILMCSGLALATMPGPDAEFGVRLLAWGAMEHDAVADGEWWRLLSAAFLHGGWGHLLFNAYALFVVGSLVEHAYGPARFAAIYVVTAIAGSLASYAAGTEMSVGASGAIFGLFGAALLTLRRGHQQIRAVLTGRHITALAAWAGYSLLLGFTDAGVDNAAHVGGLVAGLATAFLLPSGMAAGTLAALGAAALLWTGVSVATSVRMLPQLLALKRGFDAVQRNDAHEAERQFTAALPFPPARLGRALLRLEHGDTTGALADLDTALIAGAEDVRDVAHLQLAQALVRVGSAEDALRHADQARESTDPEVRQHALIPRGMALARLGRRDEALAAYTEAGTAADSEVAYEAHFRRGDVLGALDRHAEAALAYAAAARHADLSAAARWNVYIEHQRAGKTRSARAALDTALVVAQGHVARTEERDPEALRSLADILEAIGRPREAAAARRKANALGP